jgi:uncharacterized protein YoxC
MKDCSNNIRVQYLSKLSGNITYGGKSVPVYGTDSFQTVPQNYVIIGDITESADNNNQLFITEADVVIDIFSEQYMTRNNSIIDDIADQILTLLIPTTGVQDMGDAEFQIYAKARTSSRYLTMQEGNNFINRKILIINNSIIQK